MKTETKVTHTPTPLPWKVSNNRDVEIYGSSYRIVVMVGGELHRDKANAAFIVKAVNSHQEMLCLLYQCQGFTQALALNGHEGAQILHKDITDALAKAEA